MDYILHVCVLLFSSLLLLYSSYILCAAAEAKLNLIRNYGNEVICGNR